MPRFVAAVLLASLPSPESVIQPKELSPFWKSELSVGCFRVQLRLVIHVLASALELAKELPVSFGFVEPSG